MAPQANGPSQAAGHARAHLKRSEPEHRATKRHPPNCRQRIGLQHKREPPQRVSTLRPIPARQSSSPGLSSCKSQNTAETQSEGGKCPHQGEVKDLIEPNKSTMVSTEPTQGPCKHKLSFEKIELSNYAEHAVRTAAPLRHRRAPIHGSRHDV